MTDEQPEPEIQPDDWDALQQNYLGAVSAARLPEDLEIESTAYVDPSRVKEAMSGLAEITDRCHVGVVLAENEDGDVHPMLIAQVDEFEELGALVAPIIPKDDQEGWA